MLRPHATIMDRVVSEVGKFIRDERVIQHLDQAGAVRLAHVCTKHVLDVTRRQRAFAKGFIDRRAEVFQRAARFNAVAQCLGQSRQRFLARDTCRRKGCRLGLVGQPVEIRPRQNPAGGEVASRRLDNWKVNDRLTAGVGRPLSQIAWRTLTTGKLVEGSERRGFGTGDRRWRKSLRRPRRPGQPGG